MDVAIRYALRKVVGELLASGALGNESIETLVRDFQSSAKDMIETGHPLTGQALTLIAHDFDRERESFNEAGMQRVQRGVT